MLRENFAAPRGHTVIVTDVIIPHQKQKRRLAAASLAALSIFAAGDAIAACNPSSSLGVSRIVEVDNTKGLGLGSVQYSEQGLLRDKEVILTFDDGPLPRHTNPILAALKAHCTKASFFIVGRMAIAFPETVRRIHNQGHTIAVHTWSHPRLGRMSRQNAVANVERGFSAIQAALGKPISAFFRFPYLDAPSTVRAHLKSRNIVDWSIDIDSGDTRGFSSSRIVSFTMGQLRKKGKGILLFHDIKPATARAIPTLLRKLKAEGYKVVHAVSKSPATTNTSYDAYYRDLLAKRAKRANRANRVSGEPEAAKPQPKPRNRSNPPRSIFDPADMTEKGPFAKRRAIARLKRREKIAAARKAKSAARSTRLPKRRSASLKLKKKPTLARTQKARTDDDFVLPVNN